MEGPAGHARARLFVRARTSGLSVLPHREHLHVRIQSPQVARREWRLYLLDTRLGRSIWRSWRELASKPSPSAIGCRPSARSSALFGDSQGRIGCFTDRDPPNPHHFRRSSNHIATRTAKATAPPAPSPPPHLHWAGRGISPILVEHD